MNSMVIRFRVMAIIAGVMSLLLWFGYMPAKYLFSNDNWHDNLRWIPMVHGYIYPLYVLTALQLGVSLRMPLTKIVRYILAGTLPVASFIAERRVVAEHSSIN